MKVVGLWLYQCWRGRSCPPNSLNWGTTVAPMVKLPSNIIYKLYYKASLFEMFGFANPTLWMANLEKKSFLGDSRII